MAVRNFYLTGKIEGRATDIEAGPAGKSGGFSLLVQQRDNGGIKRALRVEGIAHEDGNLELYVFDENGNSVLHQTSQR